MREVVMMSSLDLENPYISLHCPIFRTHRSLSLDIRLKEKNILDSNTLWKVDAIFRVIQKDGNKKDSFESSLVWDIQEGQYYEFRSADPDEFIPNDPNKPFFLTFNLDPEIPFSLMSYLEQESLVIFHAYSDQVTISSKCFKEEK